MKRSLELLSTLAICAVALFYVCGFSMRQSLGVSLFLTLLTWQLQRGRKVRADKFTPYQIACHPNVYQMLSDIGLVETGGEFRSIVGSKRLLIPWDSNNVVDYGVYAVHISQNGATGNGVVHFPWEGRYSSDIRWDCRLTAIKRTEGLHPEVASFPWSPDVFMRPAARGYEIGVRVNAKWWKLQVANKAKVLKEDAEFNFGTVCLVLCVLPYETTNDFFHKFEQYSTPRDNMAALERAVNEGGWKIEEEVSDLGYTGETYEHRYMRVWIKSLEEG